MPVPVLTREQLAPLLQGTWSGSTAAFELLAGQPELLTAAVRRAWGSRSSTSLYQDPGDLTQQLLLQLVEKVGRRAGLPFPEDRHTDSQATSWLYTVLLNEARSLLGREKQMILLDEVLGDSATPDSRRRKPEAVTVEMDPSARLESEQLVEQIAQLRHHPEAKTHYLLAFWATEAPALLQKLPLQELPWTPSLQRPQVECLRLLSDWLRRHPYDHHNDIARRELGWILCVPELPKDPTRWWEDVAPWRQKDPDRAAQVRNLVSKWSGRAARLLEQP